jgi:hypothetical protein
MTASSTSESTANLTSSIMVGGDALRPVRFDNKDYDAVAGDRDWRRRRTRRDHAVDFCKILGREQNVRGAHIILKVSFPDGDPPVVFGVDPLGEVAVHLARMVDAGRRGSSRRHLDARVPFHRRAGIESPRMPGLMASMMRCR